MEEQRLYEALKLKRQFESILVENRLVSERHNPSMFQRKRAAPGGDADSEYRAKQALMERARRAQSSRKRRLLSLDTAVDTSIDASASAEGANSDAANAPQAAAPSKAAAAAEGAALDLAALDVRDLDFQLSYDIAALQEDVEAHRKFSKWDINLLKLIICSGAPLHSGARGALRGLVAHVRRGVVAYHLCPRQGCTHT